jgi:hypothetical protein
MSHAIAIGIRVLSGSAEDLASRSLGAAVRPCGPGSDGLMGEIFEEAAPLLPGAAWFVAVDSAGGVDLDLVYRLPNALRGSLGDSLDALISNDAVTDLALLFHDLSRLDRDVDEICPIHTMKKRLSEMYEFGGPLRGAFHVFTRRVDV